MSDATLAVQLTAPHPRIQYLDLPRFAADGLPPVQWVLEPWIRKPDIVVLAGPPKVGKSTLAAKIAVSIAYGIPFLDGPAPERPAHVLYFDEEAGAAEVVPLFLRAGASEQPGLHVASCCQLNLTDPEAVEAIGFEIGRLLPALVVFDTLTPFLGDADENNAAEVFACFRHLHNWRKIYGTSFLLVHHMRKSSPHGSGDRSLDRVRGSSAISAQASSIITAQPSDGGRTLSLSVRRRGGGTVPSARVEYVEEGSGRYTVRSLEKRGDGHSPLANKVLALVRSEGRATRALLVGEFQGHNERAIDGAIRQLRRAGKLVTVDRGDYAVSGEEQAR